MTRTSDPAARGRLPGQALFAATLIGLGLWSLSRGEFGAIWQLVPKPFPAREALVYASAAVSLATGAGLLWRRTAALAARLLVVVLLAWLLAFKVREVVLHPLVEVGWESLGESVVVLAGALTLYARRVASERAVKIARALYGLSMIAFGLTHLVYLKQTAALVPGWLPAHAAWAIATGGAYVAAGAAMLAGLLARLAATLSALQMGLFTLLVWAPMLLAGAKDPSAWSEAVVSWMLTVDGWVVAETYRGQPWLSRESSGSSATRRG